MSAETALADSARPLLPRGVRLHHDRVRGRWVLLAPERALNLDQVGHAILKEVDGERSLAEIAARLAATYGAPLEQVTKDTRGFLQALLERRMLELAR